MPIVTIRRSSRRAAAVVALVSTLVLTFARAASPARADGAISFVASSSASALAASSLTIDKPTGLQKGDLFLAVIVVRGKPTVTAPSGWTFIRHDGRSHLYHRISDGGEPASYTWTLSSKHNVGGSIVVYRGVDQSSPIDASNGKRHPSDSSTITAPSVTTNVDGARVVGVFAIGAQTTIAQPSGFGEQLDEATGGTLPITWEVSDMNQAFRGSTGDEVATAGASGSNMGELVALTPAQSVPEPPTYRAFENTSYWNSPLPSDVPIDAHSADIIGYLKTGNDTNYIKFSGVSDAGDWGMPIYWAKTTDPSYDVPSSCSTRVPPEFASIRVPSGAAPDPSSDAAMVIYDLEKGLVYSFWQAKYDGSTWTSCGGAVYYTASNGLHGSLPGSDQGANDGHRGVPPAMFAVRYDEIQAVEIDHVLKIAVNDTKCAHVFPMVGDECGVTDQWAPPEGTRIQLKPSIDLSKYGLSPAALVIATALQKYGAVIGDQSGGSVSLKVENAVAEGLGQLWSGVLGAKDLDAFSLDDYQVIQLGWGG